MCKESFLSKSKNFTTDDVNLEAEFCWPHPSDATCSHPLFLKICLMHLPLQKYNETCHSDVKSLFLSVSQILS